MEDKRIDNTISVLEEVLEKYKDDEGVKDAYEQLMDLKESRKEDK